MKACIQELRDNKGKVIVAKISMIVDPNDKEAVNVAKIKLNEWVFDYILNRPHCTYTQIEEDTISAVIVFDSKSFTEKIIDI